jgi:FkbM family methyltransferase
LLQRSIDLNGFGARTTVERVALGAVDDERLALYVPASEPKNALIVANADVVDRTAGSLVEVPSVKLDRLCADLGKVDFIKIDAEGSEERIYQGMKATVERCRPTIVMEFNAARYRDPGAFIDRMLANYGSLYAIDFDGVASRVKREELLTTRVGEDWLVVLSAKPPA